MATVALTLPRELFAPRPLLPSAREPAPATADELQRAVRVLSRHRVDVFLPLDVPTRARGGAAPRLRA